MTNMGTGNMGTGNMGIGNVGANGGPPPGGFFADRVDLPFVTTSLKPGCPIATQQIDIASYPTRNWAPAFYSWLVLTEFVGTDWKHAGCDPQWLKPDWARDGAIDAWPGPENCYVKRDLGNLITAGRDERADALGEIVGQSEEFLSYFLNLVSATAGYPATTKVLTIASFIAGFCAMYYKGLYRRPRPTMLCPALLPPIPIPGHASFPSGHSTQAHLMALCMEDVLPTPAPDNARSQKAAMTADLTALADRIARNREIAGLHYPTDTDAGKKLADYVHGLLNGLPEGSWYQLALADARAEWSS